MQKVISGKLARFFALFAASAALVLAFCAPSSAFADGLYRDSYNLFSGQGVFYDEGENEETGEPIYFACYPFDLSPGTYTFSSNQSNIVDAYAVVNYIDGSTHYPSINVPFTVPDGATVSALYFAFDTSQECLNFASGQNMLNAGSSALSYEPYGVEQMDVDLIASWFSGMGNTFLGFLGSNTAVVFLVVGAVCIIFLVVTFARKKVLRG